MSKYYVYILQSLSNSKFYVGQTNDLNKRIEKHNLGYVKSTKNRAPWKLIFFVELSTRSEAIILERKIKGRGIKRYLEKKDILGM